MAEYYVRENQNYSTFALLDSSSSSILQDHQVSGDPLYPDYNSMSNSMSNRFQMMERIAVKNKATAYREAVSSIYESNPLSDSFFSKENIESIQASITAQVYERSNKQFSAPLNINDTKCVMRDIYLECAKDVLSTTPSGGGGGGGKGGALEYLNKKVLDHCAPVVYSESVAYLKFLSDQNYLPTPLLLPLQPDRSYKDLELAHFF